MKICEQLGANGEPSLLAMLFLRTAHISVAHLCLQHKTPGRHLRGEARQGLAKYKRRRYLSSL